MTEFIMFLILTFSVWFVTIALLLPILLNSDLEENLVFVCKVSIGYESVYS